MFEPVQMKTFHDPALIRIEEEFNKWNTFDAVIVETQTHYSAALQQFFTVVLYSLRVETQESEEEDVD